MDNKIIGDVKPLGSTTFIDNSTTLVSETREVMPYTEIMSQVVDNNDISDFMSKPVIQATFTFGTSNGFNDVVNSGSIADLMEATPIWYRKLAGYRMIRGTAVVKLVVNANPFQQGKLLLHFLPCYRNMPNLTRTMHNGLMTVKTQQPSVELDLSDGTCELRIPYVAPTLFYDRVSGFDWGTYFVSVLSEFKTGSGGSLDVECNVFLSFEDVQLSGPIFGPEGGSTKKNARAVRKERTKVSRSGTVTTILDSVSDASGVLSNIPIIGSYANVFSGVTKGFADMCNVFGWSKPISDQVAKPVDIRPLRHMQNFDGAMNADVFALGSNPMLPPTAEFAGTSVDEMSFSYLKKIPAYISKFEWNGTQVHDTLLSSIEVGPKYLYGEDSLIKAGYRYYYRAAPPAFHLSKYFHNWRGGIKIHFKLVKTQFHSGRLLISFSTKDETISNAASAYLLREVIDVRTMNEFTLTIPYIRSTNYLMYDEGDLDPSFDLETLGSLSIRVLNELRSPETCSQSIEVLVFASAADDFEVVYPRQTKNVLFSPESGLTEAVEKNLGEHVIGDAKKDRDSLAPNMMSFSDPFTSVKQLLDCSRQIYFQTAGAPLAGGFSLDPFSLGAIATTPFIDFPTPYGLYGDYVSELSAGYAFSRGGIRISVPYSDITANYYVALVVGEDQSVYGGYEEVIPYTYTGWDPDNGNKYQAMITGRNGQWSYDVVVPHYGITPLRLNRYKSYNATDTAMDVNKCHLHFTPNGQAGNSIYPAFNSRILRSGADDLCLGYFIGFPPVYDRRIEEL